MAFDKKSSLGFIDVASGKVRVMIMSIDKNSKFVLQGKSEVESVGYKGGKILDFDAFSNSINTALEIAEKQVGKNISDVVISLSDFKYKSYFLKSKIDLPFERKITDADIKKCTSNLSLNQTVNFDKETLVHVIPVEYIIDNNRVVDNPEGNFAKSLVIRYHIITVDSGMYSSLIKIFNSLNLNVRKVVASAYASSLSSLIDDDRQVGTLLIDIGKSTMSVAIFIDDKLCYNYSFPLGGDAITNTISKQMNVRFSEAERLKIRYGAKPPMALDFSDYINVYMIGDNGENDEREILKSDYLTVSSNATRSLFLIIKKYFEQEKVLSYINRVVVTGGGSKLSGIKDIISEVFSCPVRCAKPVKQEELSENFDDANYATLVGLFLFYKLKSVTDYTDFSLEGTERKNVFDRFMKFWMENFG